MFFSYSTFFSKPQNLKAASLEESQSRFPWKVGEKFSYSIRWGIIAAGKASLEVKEISLIEISSGTSTKKIPAYHFKATAHSNAVIDLFYKVRDINESWLDTSQWITHRFEQHNQEGKYILDQIVEFDWIAKRFKNIENVKGREPKIEEGDLTIPAVDTLSSLYKTRAKSFNVGDEFTLDVHSGRNWPLVVKVLKRETVKTEAGKYDCYLVEPFLRERGLFIQKGKKLQVWLTADEKKIPVLMQAEIFIGKVSAELIKMEFKPE